METQHGSNLPDGVLAQVERLEGERRDLDSLLRHRVQALIDAARLEGIDVGFRAGRDAEKEEQRQRLQNSYQGGR